MKHTTLGELGYVTPIGNMSFSFRPWTFAQERAIGALRSTKKMTVANFVISVLSLMLDSYGDDFSAQDDKQKRKLLNAMHLADVLYMYIMLRVNALGDEITVAARCPRCDNDNEVTVSLNDLDVDVPESEAELDVVVSMSTPIVTEARTITDFTVHAPQWAVMHDKNIVKDNQALRTMAIVMGSVIAVNGSTDDGYLVMADLDAMTKHDYEVVSAALDGLPSPRPVLEAQCEYCASDIYAPLDWSYDNFFGLSSRQHPNKT